MLFVTGPGIDENAARLPFFWGDAIEGLGVLPPAIPLKFHGEVIGDVDEPLVSREFHDQHEGD